MSYGYGGSLQLALDHLSDRTPWLWVHPSVNRVGWTHAAAMTLRDEDVREDARILITNKAEVFQTPQLMIVLQDGRTSFYIHRDLLKGA